MNAQKTFEHTLAKHHQSHTRTRQQVFDALAHHANLSMRELTRRCSNVDRASVYRSVKLFEQLGIIVRIPHGWKYRLELGEAFHEHHHHATCDTCGASIALPEDSTLEDRLQELASRRHFRLTSHQIELHGQCQNCQNN
ncbi:transcriptional repressor [Candidatus Saccharibacteria bacterium]|jgi:Fe2+ or Zn2+ uptake regulation protein|nr:transcriptional repressor [Candidatus Saccharibacteria bacterium]HPR09698.1 transcriptional repressor [Candidatus Saccharibacteria bacterium]